MSQPDRARIALRNDFRAKLIKLVHEREYLWNQKHQFFSNRVFKMHSWQEVADKLSEHSDKIRRTWENLRDQFRRDLKRQLKYGTRSKWRFYDDMSFIRSMVRVKELNGACNSESESEELDTLQDEYEHDNLSGIVMETNLTTPMPDLDDQPSTSATAAAITEMPNYLPIQLSTEWQQLTGDMSRMERQNYQREQIECRQLQEQARQEYDFMRHKQQMQQYQKRQQHKQQHRQHKLQQLELQKHLEVQEQQKLQERQQQQQKQQRRQQQQQQQLELQQQQIQQHQQERQQQTQLQQHKPQKPHLEDPQEPQQKCDSSDETKFDADFHAELPEMVKIEIESDSDDQDCMPSLHLAVVASPEMIIPTIDHRDASLSEEVCVTTSASTSSNAPKRSRSAEESSEIKAEYAIKHVRLAQSQQEREVPDEDYHFVMSILPSLRQISRSRKFPLRMSIMDMISKELESDEQD